MWKTLITVQIVQIALILIVEVLVHSDRAIWTVLQLQESVVCGAITLQCA